MERVGKSTAMRGGAGGFGTRLRELRLSREMSQIELARRIGRHQTAIGPYERGEYAPPRDIVERLAVSCRGGVVDVPDLPTDVTRAALSESGPQGVTNLREMLRKVEAGIVREALQRYGTQTKAAKHLGVGQATIARKARRLDLAAAARLSASE